MAPEEGLYENQHPTQNPIRKPRCSPVNPVECGNGRKKFPTDWNGSKTN